MMKKDIQENHEIFINRIKVAEAHCWLEKSESFDKIIIQSLVEKFKKSSYMERIGFNAEEDLAIFLESVISGDQECTFSTADCLEIFQTINEVFLVLSKYLQGEVIQLFILPTHSRFVLEKMSGTGGFCTNHNSIIITLNPKKGIKEALTQSIIHEFTHAVSPFYDMEKMSLGEGFIFDGLAEHFLEQTYSKYKPFLTASLSKEEALKEFSNLRAHLESKDVEVYRKVFFGTGEYKLWAGYSIGYFAVGEYLKDKKHVSWADLLRSDPKKILKEIVSKYEL